MYYLDNHVCIVF
jgi:flap endonuclease-1